MAINIRDKDIDKKLEEMANQLKKDFGIKHVSKTDAIRFLLKIRKQGNKTSKKWLK